MMKKYLLMIICILSTSPCIIAAQERHKQSCFQLFRASLVTFLVFSQNSSAAPQTDCYKVCTSDLYGREISVNLPMCKEENPSEVRNHLQQLLDAPLKEVQLCKESCEKEKRLYCLSSVEAIKNEHIERWRPAGNMLFKRNS